MVIVATAGGLSEGYFSWIFCTMFVICGIGNILQTFRFWRFGSGYSVSIATLTAYIAVASSALLAGGPLLLSALMAVSSLVQFVFHRPAVPAAAGNDSPGGRHRAHVAARHRDAQGPGHPAGRARGKPFRYGSHPGSANLDYSPGYASVHFTKVATIFSLRSGGARLRDSSPAGCLRVSESDRRVMGRLSRISTELIRPGPGNDLLGFAARIRDRKPGRYDPLHQRYGSASAGVLAPARSPPTSGWCRERTIWAHWPTLSPHC